MQARACASVSSGGGPGAGAGASAAAAEASALLSGAAIARVRAVVVGATSFALHLRVQRSCGGRN
jgi:hypothetical protein